MVLASLVHAVLYHKSGRGLVAPAWGRNCRQPLNGVSGTAWVAVGKGRRRRRVGWLGGRRYVQRVALRVTRKSWQLKDNIVICI